ncbi:uncharacterized protein [Paralichthys olivaceus]|uniref:uncharacterized protein n=1 Tax=Paralichthys olivaceus TaxID=8255 RepID=UPI003751DF18
MMIHQMMKSVALVVMTMMMLSAAPLPPSLNNSRFEFDHFNETMDVLSMNFPQGPWPSLSRCALSTCLTTNLVSSMQSGDETAGSATSDPYGIGKK